MNHTRSSVRAVEGEAVHHIAEALPFPQSVSEPQLRLAVSTVGPQKVAFETQVSTSFFRRLGDLVIGRLKSLDRGLTSLQVHLGLNTKTVERNSEVIVRHTAALKENTVAVDTLTQQLKSGTHMHASQPASVPQLGTSESVRVNVTRKDHGFSKINHRMSPTRRLEDAGVHKELREKILSDPPTAIKRRPKDGSIEEFEWRVYDFGRISIPGACKKIVDLEPKHPWQPGGLDHRLAITPDYRDERDTRLIAPGEGFLDSKKGVRCVLASEIDRNGNGIDCTYFEMPAQGVCSENTRFLAVRKVRKSKKQQFAV